MTRNLWTANAALLAEAYTRNTGMLGFLLVTKALSEHLPDEPQRIVDVGGGFGRQAILLARAGHSVVVVDCDPVMLDAAREQLTREAPDVAARVELVAGEGARARELVGDGFDAACCHSVLMYQEDAGPMLAELAALVRRGGLVSVLCVSPEAAAMRSGLQGRWAEAVALLRGEPLPEDSRYLPTRDHSRREVAELLEAAGAPLVDWYGVGVFSDHLTERVEVDDPELVFAAEWLAGRTDPYRNVARSYHLIARRGPPKPARGASRAARPRARSIAVVPARGDERS